MRALLLALALVAAAPAPASDELPKGILAVDPRPAPALRLADIDGRGYDLEADRGRWVLVHFWASWCGPCRREMPAIERMQARLGGQGPALVLVNTAEDADTIFEFLATAAPSLESLSDRDGLVTEAWRPRGLPATYLVDPRGRIRYQALGGRDWDQEPYLGFLRGLRQAAELPP